MAVSQAVRLSPCAWSRHPAREKTYSPAVWRAMPQAFRIAACVTSIAPATWTNS